MRHGEVALLLLILLLSGCEIISPEHDPQEPGALSLEYAFDSDDASDVVDLGDIRNTRSYDFYLSNTGEADLFDVSINSSSNQFLIEPTTIRALRSEERQTPHSNLRITLLHGTSASGVGSAPVLDAGLNEANLDIMAKTTTDEGDTVAVRLQTRLNVTAHLVDVEVYDSQGALDLYTITNALGIVGERRFYRVGNGPIRIVNTGNVRLLMQISRQMENPPQATFEESNIVLEPLEEVIIERERERIFFRIDAEGTISDLAKLPIQQDGFIYFVCSP